MLSLRSTSLQAQSSPAVYSLPITISNQGVAYDAKTNLIVATDYKNNVVRLVNLTTGASTSVTVGTRPVAAAIYATSSKSYAYIGNEGSDNVSVIDLSTKSVIKTITVGQSPASIAINSSTGKGYVANFKSDNVSILTLSTNIVTATTAVGSEPASVAISAATNKLYVANSKIDTISVIDGTSNAVTATIPVGQSPVFVVVNSGKSMAYSVNSKGNSVSAINLSTNIVTATIPVGPEPESMAIDATKNTGYVANLYNDSVSVLNLSTNTVTGTYAVGRDPIGVAYYSPYLIVATQRGDGLWVINTTTQPFGTTVPVGKDPDGIAVDPTTNRALTANEKSNDVSIVDLFSAQVIATIPVGNHPTAVAINSATQTALTANEKDDTLSVIDLTTKSVIGTIAVGKSPVAVAINPQINIAATANRKADSVSVVDIANHSVIGTISVGKSPSAVAIQPTGNIGVVANRKDNTISILDLSNRHVISTIAVGKDPAVVAIDADLNLAVVTNNKDNTASLIDLNSKAVVATVNVGKGPLGVAINPSTHRAAIANFIDGTITVIDLPSRQVVQTLSAGKSPEAVDINPNTNQAVVTLDSLNLLTILQLNNPVPVISGLVPVSISAGNPAFTLTVQGSQFITTSVVKFNGQAMATQFVSTTRLTASIPVSAITTPGTVPVTVTNPAPVGGVSNSVSFAIGNPAPILTSIVPNVVLVGSPQGTLIVNGQKFISGAVVSFAGQSLATTFVNSTQLSAIVPATLMSKSGLFDIKVINPAPGGGASNAVTFTVNNPVPAITSLAPTSTLAGSGNTALIVNGSKFVGTSTVQWNGTALATTYVSAGQLSATIPANMLTSTGSFTVTVVNPTPGGGTSNAQSFTVNNPVPSITTISPASIATGSGSFTLRVNGTNFLLSSIVTFNGQPLATTFVSNTQLTATVPASDTATSQTAQIGVVNSAPGGGNATPVNLIVDQLPVADAGTARSALVGKAISLDGRKSSDADGNRITFAWSVASAPPESTAQLTNSTSVTPSLTPDVAGTYNIQLVVNDGFLNSAPAFVTVTTSSPNVPPNADAGSDQTAMVGQTVTLDGRKSFDSDNDQITYQWSIVSAPSGSAVPLTDADSVIASLTPNVAGIYVAQLIVNDGTASSQPMQVTITIASPNVAPMANAGKDRNVLMGSLVTLDGSKSHDPDGETITYRWFFVSIPSGSAAIISGATTSSPTFTPDQSGEYLIRLVVNDGASNSKADTILIKAAAPNAAPNALSGPDQSVHQTETVTLDGTGSTDPNGDPITYSWQIVSVPNGSQAALSDASAGKPTFVADTAGKYVLRLVASDGVNNSLPDTVVITAAPITQLDVTPINPSILQGQTVSFTATATFGDSTTKDVTSLVAWTSSNLAVATINDAGVATALTAGTALIHASIGSVASPDQIMTVTSSTPFPTITDFSPKDGTTGTLVTIVGSNFNHAPVTISFNGVQSVISDLTENQITTVVSPGVITGPLSVKTSIGTATSATAFTVRLRQDFELSINPQNATISANGSASFTVTLVDKGIVPFTGLVKLSLQNSPAGITGTFNPQYVSLNRASTLTLTSQQGNQAIVTIQGDASIEGSDVAKTIVINLNSQTPGATILRGRILATKDANPIARVTVKLGTQTVITDGGGNFTIMNPPAGDQVFIINGDTANHDGITYPSALPVAVNIAAGADNTLPAPIYLHEVKTSYFTQINPSIDTIVTDPEIPNYEMRIPAGTVITGWDGQPNTKVSVKPIPVDRLPIPSPPAGVYATEIYMYYFFKPGGGTPSQPIPVKMPNTFQASPGTRVKLWYYDESFTPDPNSNQWKSFGMGTVSSDGRNVIPDPGVGIPKFCCGASFADSTPSVNPASPVDSCLSKKVADPIDPFTGFFTYSKTDIGYPVPSNLRIDRQYNSGNATVGPFGLGSSINYNHFLRSSGSALTYIPPEGGSYVLSMNADGSYTNINYPFLQGTKAYLNTDGTRTLNFKNGEIYSFDTAGRLSLITDRNNNLISIQRDGMGFLTDFTDSFGRRVLVSNTTIQIGSLIYTLISSLMDMSGRIVQYNYDGGARLNSVILPDGSTTTYSYDGAGRIISITNPRGNVEVTNQYDASGRVIQQTHADGGVFNIDYNVVGGSVTQTAVTEPNGGTTTYRLNGAGYSSEIIDANGQKTTYGRAFSSNNLNSVTDPLGRTTTYAYDVNGNTTSVTDPVGNVTTYEYDPVLNKPTKITDALGNKTTLTYDLKGNLIQILSPKTELTTIGYNMNSQPVSITDALGNISTFEYDEFGNFAKSTDPLGNSAQMEYDFIGRLISAIDPKGKLTLYSYDAMNRVLDITDAMNGKTFFSYDGNGNLLSVTDAKNQTITYTYNVRDKAATMTDQLGKTESYSYDQDDNLASITDRKGQTSAYQYDLKNKATKATYADGSSSNYTYDAIGRLTYIIDSVSGSIEYIYGNTGCAACGGAIDKIIQEITPLGSVSYTYDAVGRRASMTVAGQPVVNYAYDSDSRLSNINTTIGGVGQGFSLAHDAIGRRTSLVMPNGVKTTYAYDTASRLLNMNHLNPLNAVFESLSYTYDASGNKTSTSRPAVNLPLPSSVSNTSFNQANQMQTVNDKTITYDNNGNMTSETNSCGTTTYTWDARNRLVGMIGFNTDCSPLAASFKYDTLGRRVEKTINGQIIHYLYDGMDIVQEIEGGTVAASYIRGLNIDQTLARIKSDGTVRYYQADALGSVIALTDETGASMTQYAYDPFGNVSAAGDVSENPFQFTGRENDETGLYYYRARYYSPNLHRFISEDPIGLLGGINKFSYVGNNPVNRKDPLGLWSLDLTFYFGGGGGVIIGRNPDGGLFTTFRYGYGLGGGPSYNPKGISPGYDPCQKNNGLNISFGGFAGASVGGYHSYAGVSTAGGFTAAPGQPYDGYFDSPQFDWGAAWGWSFNAGAAAGGEITFH